MSILTALLSGFALQGALIIAIGAQNTFVLRQGLGREHVGSVVLFCVCADLLLTSAGIMGIGASLATAPGLIRALTLGGAGYLAWYGLGAARRALDPSSLIATEVESGPTRRAVLGRAAAFTLLNPGVWIDAILLVGTSGAGHPPAERPVFVLGVGVASLAWFAALGYGARLLAPVFARPAAWRWLDGGIAALMLTLAAGLAGQATA